MYIRKWSDTFYMLKKWNDYLKKDNNGIIIAYCLVLAFAFLTICSRSSFLYPHNNWDDANSYFSMGKFMMNGGIIYRDLYDQKGPYLYLLYGLAYLISNDTFFGVFIMEIIAITAFLLGGYCILRLYCSKGVSVVLLPVLAMSTLSSLSFYWGGAAEEFCIPFMIWSLYMSLRYFKEDYPDIPDWKMILLNGIFAGIIMQVKYIMLGFYFAWMAMMALMHFTPANIKKSLRNCFVFLGGMGLTMIPWLIYFGIHGALDDWYQCYIYNNIFLYSDLNSNSISLYGKIYYLAKILINLIIDNFSYFVFIVIGMVYLLLRRQSWWYEKINIYAMFVFLFVGIYIGGASIFYYSIPLTIFPVLGLAYIGEVFEWIKVKLSKKTNSIHVDSLDCGEEVKNSSFKWSTKQCVVTSMSIVLCLVGAYSMSMNTDYMQVDKKELFLYDFAEIINREENPTLLNVNMLDAGLYTVADVVPSVKFFQTNGIAYEHMFEEQERYIKEGITQFVISRFDYPEYMLDKYELIADASFATDGKNETMYYLFKLKDMD